MKTYKIANCLKGKNIYWRDDDLDRWLSKELPILPEGKIKYKELPRGMTFKEIAQELYGTTDIKELEKHSFSLPQVEKMIEEEEKDLLSNGYANLFPVISDDKIFWLSVRRSDRDWGVCVYRFDYGGRWHQGYRAFSRNGFEPETLGNLEPISLELINKKLDVLLNHFGLTKFIK